MTLSLPLPLDVEEIPTPPSAPYALGSDTSRDAAESIVPVLAAQEAKVAALLKLYGPLTVDEVEVYGDLRHQSAGARMRGLVLKGRVRDSGERRLTRSGRKAVVWNLVPQEADR